MDGIVGAARAAADRDIRLGDKLEMAIVSEGASYRAADVDLKAH